LCRPAFAASRLEQLEDGTIRMSLKSIWRGGITAVFLSAYELVVRVLAQIPLPFCATVHYHGCFAGNAKLRSKVVLAGDKPKARRKKSATEKDETTKLCQTSTRNRHRRQLETSKKRAAQKPAALAHRVGPAEQGKASPRRA